MESVASLPPHPVSSSAAKSPATRVIPLRSYPMPPKANSPGPERDPCEDQREAAEGRGAEALAEEDRAIGQRDRGDQVRHERRVGGTGAGDEAEEAQVRERRPGDPERYHGADRLPAGHLRGRLGDSDG